MIFSMCITCYVLFPAHLPMLLWNMVRLLLRGQICLSRYGLLTFNAMFYLDSWWQCGSCFQLTCLIIVLLLVFNVIMRSEALQLHDLCTVSVYNRQSITIFDNVLKTIINLIFRKNFAVYFHASRSDLSCVDYSGL